jgi:hypothetical protein
MPRAEGGRGLRWEAAFLVTVQYLTLAASFQLELDDQSTVEITTLDLRPPSLTVSVAPPPLTGEAESAAAPKPAGPDVGEEARRVVGQVSARLGALETVLDDAASARAQLDEQLAAAAAEISEVVQTTEQPPIVEKAAEAERAAIEALERLGDGPEPAARGGLLGRPARRQRQELAGVRAQQVLAAERWLSRARDLRQAAEIDALARSEREARARVAEQEIQQRRTLIAAAARGVEERGRAGLQELRDTQAGVEQQIADLRQQHVRAEGEAAQNAAAHAAARDLLARVVTESAAVTARLGDEMTKLSAESEQTRLALEDQISAYQLEVGAANARIEQLEAEVEGLSHPPSAGRPVTEVIAVGLLLAGIVAGLAVSLPADLRSVPLLLAVAAIAATVFERYRQGGRNRPLTVAGTPAAWWAAIQSVGVFSVVVALLVVAGGVALLTMPAGGPKNVPQETRTMAPSHEAPPSALRVIVAKPQQAIRSGGKTWTVVPAQNQAWAQRELRLGIRPGERPVAIEVVVVNHARRPFNLVSPDYRVEDDHGGFHSADRIVGVGPPSRSGGLVQGQRGSTRMIFSVPRQTRRITLIWESRRGSASQIHVPLNLT